MVLCGGSGGPPREKFSVLRWLNPLKFNSKHLAIQEIPVERAYNGKLIKASLDDSSIDSIVCIYTG